VFFSPCAAKPTINEQPSGRGVNTMGASPLFPVRLDFDFFQHSDGSAGTLLPYLNNKAPHANVRPAEESWPSRRPSHTPLHRRYAGFSEAYIF